MNKGLIKHWKLRLAIKAASKNPPGIRKTNGTALIFLVWSNYSNSLTYASCSELAQRQGRRVTLFSKDHFAAWLIAKISFVAVSNMFPGLLKHSFNLLLARSFERAFFYSRPIWHYSVVACIKVPNSHSRLCSSDTLICRLAAAPTS